MVVFLIGISALLFAQNKEQKLRELFETYAKLHKFNGSVLVAQNGKVLLHEGYGLKSVQDSVKNDANTIYQIGSITKQFTAVAILKLQEQKKLSTKDKITKYFPGYPKGDSITIEHLLTHTSGIPNYTNDQTFMAKSATLPISETAMIALFKDKPLDFSPGTKWNYSNSGYMLLGYIIQRVTKKPYEQVIRDMVFNPLNMQSSGFNFSGLSDARKAKGYFVLSETEHVEASLVDSSVSYAAGAIYSSTGDLYNWYRGLISGRVISKESLKTALNPVRNKYGYGFLIDSIHGEQVVSHSGGIFGFTSNLAMVPQDDVFVAMVNNYGNPNLMAITKDALAIVYEKSYTLPSPKKEIKLNAEVLGRYTGVYELTPQFKITITAEGERLFGQPTGQPRAELFAEKEDRFFLKVIDAEVEFKRDENGKVIQLILLQGGQTHLAKKVE